MGWQECTQNFKEKIVYSKDQAFKKFAHCANKITVGATQNQKVIIYQGETCFTNSSRDWKPQEKTFMLKVE